MNKEFSLANPCLECVKSNLSCCFFKNDTDVSRVLPISEIECRNIIKFLGISSIETCFEEEIITQKFQTSLQNMFPEIKNIKERFPVGEERWRFALRGAIKHCVFLTSKGCFLPRSVRPILCRIFPFWIFEKGQLGILGTCRLASSALSIREDLDNANMNVAELYALHSLFQTFLGLTRKEG